MRGTRGGGRRIVIGGKLGLLCWAAAAEKVECAGVNTRKGQGACKGQGRISTIAARRKIWVARFKADKKWSRRPSANETTPLRQPHISIYSGWQRKSKCP